jgi:hypothetical protein
MTPSTQEQRQKCDENLSREAVVLLLDTYRPGQHVTWSASRVLYRLKITKTKKSPPAALKRRAARILDALVTEGILMRKESIKSHSAQYEWSEMGYVLSPHPPHHKLDV